MTITLKNEMIRSQFILLVMCLCFPLILSFNDDILALNPSLITTNAFCIQDIQNDSSGGIFQNKITRSLFYTPDGLSTSPIITFTMISFKQIKCLSKQRMVLLAQNGTIYEYNYTSGTKTSFDSTWANNINILQISNTESKLVYVKNQTIRIKQFPLTSLSPQTSYTINTTISTLKCSINRDKSLDGYCFIIPSNKSSLLFFHISQPQIIYQRSMPGLSFISITEIYQRIYVGFTNGQIRQYSMLEKGVLLFQRETHINSGFAIVALTVNQIKNQIFYINSAYKIGIISLTSGYEIGFTNEVSTFAGPLTTITILSRNSIAVLNPSQISPTIKLINAENIITNSSSNLAISNPLAKLCTNQMQFYNSSIGQCDSCIKGCSLCDQETGQCLQCSDGYFMSNYLCLSCKYASLTSDYYSLCFEESQITVLSYTTAITPALTSTIHFTYSFLSCSALLFLFLRFISFWSIVSVYYFLNIDEIPYFLLQILSKIFDILYGSVFQMFGIDLSSINMGISQKNINQKMISTKITTDFLAANFQSIIMYLYSLLMICVLYNGIKNWFKKFKIHLLENVKLEACLEEFVGMFIPLLVPLNLFIEDLSFGLFGEKINNASFMLFLGIGIFFPFFYCVLTLKRVTLKKRIFQIKNSLKQKGIISRSTIKNSQKHFMKKYQQTQKNMPQKRLIKILNQQETQKFLYCLNCFWSPFLVGFKSPSYFLAFGFIVHVLSFWNAFYAKQWKYNMIIGKLIFFLFHLSFILMKIIPSQYFYFSIMSFLLIIVGGFHQLLSNVGQKIYFIFLVLKNKGIIKSNKIAMDQNQQKKQIIFDQSVQQKSLQSKMSIQQISSQNFHKSTLKNIQTTRTNVQKSTKKIIKKVKIIDKKQTIVKNIIDDKVLRAFTWNQEKSLQNIDLTTKESEETKNKKVKNKVKFSNVQNTTTKINLKYSENNNPIKIQTRSQHKNQYQKQNFKIQNLNKFQRRALFDQQFSDFQQKQNKQSQEQIKPKINTQINLAASFSYPQELKKKKIKFLRMEDSIKKFGQFSKTQPQAKRVFSINQN